MFVYLSGLSVVMASRNGHLKRKIAMHQTAKKIEEMTTAECLQRELMAKDTPSGSNEFLMPTFEKEQDDDSQPATKRAKTTTDTSNPFCHLQNLGVLQDCKTLPFVIALSALLIELCDEKDPQVLCNVLEIANQIKALKKGTSSNH